MLERPLSKEEKSVLSRSLTDIVMTPDKSYTKLINTNLEILDRLKRLGLNSTGMSGDVSSVNGEVNDNWYLNRLRKESRGK